MRGGGHGRRTAPRRREHHVPALMGDLDELYCWYDVGDLYSLTRRVQLGVVRALREVRMWVVWLQKWY